MAELKKVIEAENGCRAWLKEDGKFLWIDGHWPMDEYDELNIFINQARGENKNE